MPSKCTITVLGHQINSSYIKLYIVVMSILKLYISKVPGLTLLIRLSTTLLVLVIVIACLKFNDQLIEYQSAGYFGVFLLSLIGSASVVIPVTGIAFVCAAPNLGMSPIWVAVIASVAESIGEFSGYILGLSGREFAKKSKLYPSLENWTKRYGAIMLTMSASIPNPFFDLVGISAGALRYPVAKFFAAVWIGKLIKSLTIAYGCYYGIQFVTELFGKS